MTTDEANRNYYNHTMLTRRVRAVIEADVEWRPDDPAYLAGIVESHELEPQTGVRVLHTETVSYEIVGEPACVDELMPR